MFNEPSASSDTTHFKTRSNSPRSVVTFCLLSDVYAGLRGKAPMMRKTMKATVTPMAMASTLPSISKSISTCPSLRPPCPSGKCRVEAARRLVSPTPRSSNGSDRPSPVEIHHYRQPSTRPVRLSPLSRRLLISLVGEDAIFGRSSKRALKRGAIISSSPFFADSKRDLAHRTAITTRSWKGLAEKVCPDPALPAVCV